MSRINDLIKKLCPNGVEYKSIKDTCVVLKKGTLKTTDLLESGYPVINSGRNLYGYYDQYNNDGNAFTVAARGEYAGYINYFSDKFWAGGLCYPYRSKSEELFNTKFIYYCLKNIEKTIRKEIVADGSIPALNKGDLELILIPVPPLEVQKEIVKILDKFSDNGLEKLLLTELELRKQQYEYYLKLAFKNVKGKRISLGSIVNFQRGKRVVKKDLESNKNVNLFPVYQNSLTPLGYYDKSNYDGNKTIIISAGAAGKIGFVEEKIWAADDCLRCFCSNEILDKFLYYFLKSNENYIQSMVRRASVPRISSSVFEKMLVTLPSIDEQKKIIEVFDRFEKIINNVNDGLPCEIELRRKQYEYYRNKLLSFEELSVSE